MIFRGICLAVLVCLPHAALADGSLRALSTSEDGKGWEAVGRLDIGDSGYCTGALIAPDLVLTAAHCLYRATTGARVPLEEFVFLAGWRNGRAAAYRRVRRAAIHPDYVYQGSDRLERVAIDVALLQLDQPIRNSSIRPFATAARPNAGDEVGVVSYAAGRDEAPSLEEVCQVLARRAQVLILTCDIDFGASGAPIFVIEDGEARIVSVIAAKSEFLSRRVALAAELDETLEIVRRELAVGDGVFFRPPQVAPPAVPPPVPSPAASGGAKFVRP